MSEYGETSQLVDDQADQDRPDISVVIVSYRTPELVCECVHSVRRSAGRFNVQIVIVDNDSQDGTVDLLRQRLPRETIIASPENGGFARGNELGFRQAVGRRILLLNPDAEVHAETLRNAVAALDADPRIGVIGAKVRLPDGRYQSSMIRFYSLRALLFSIFLPVGLGRRLAWAGDTRYASRDPDRPQDVDAVAGGFMLIRREVLEQVGGLDPRFFMYGEEVEWCHRIRRAGWRIVYRPDVTMLHHGGASTSHRTVWKAREMMRGQLLYFAIVHGSGTARAAAALMIMRDLVRLPVALVLSVRRSGRERLRATLARLKLGISGVISPPRGQQTPLLFPEPGH